MSKKMSDINQSVNRLINQSQSIRSIKSVNQLIHRHQLFRHHSDKHFFNHYILICHTTHSTLQSISSIIRSLIIRTINHSTNQSISMHQSIRTRSSNHRVHHTSSIKFGLLRKHLNWIYLNQFNHLHLNHLNHLNHLHSRSHQHLKSLQNQFISVNHSMFRMMIIRDNWHYWIKFIRRTKNLVTRAAILTSKYWSFMTNVDARDYSSMRICRVSRSCFRIKHLITSIQICNFAIHFMTFVST
jgi:hypothetical protein